MSTPDAEPADRQATSQIGVYLQPAQIEDAKAAYLADWTTLRQSDTFGRWIGAAIATYARRTPKQRAGWGKPKGRAEVRTGRSRTFVVPATAVDAMRAALAADHANNRWPSASAWCGEAIDLAVDAARTRAGGALPTPPARLPFRLL